MNDVLWIHCLTPLHNGASQGIAQIDRPIIREVTTEYPYIQSSTLKGALRAIADGNDAYEERIVKAAFGAEGGTKDNGSLGCVGFTDAQLLLFPVRSLAGTMAFTTSLLALSRLQRSLHICGIQGPLGECVDALLKDASSLNLGEEEALLASGGEAALAFEGTATCCIENLVLKGRREPDRATRLSSLAGALAGQLFAGDAYLSDFFKARLMLLNDDTFTRLVRKATIIEANIKIGETGLTKEGSLRYTEYLPAETVLTSLCTMTKPPYQAVKLKDIEDLAARLVNSSYLTGAPSPNGYGLIQFGGDESKGKGLTSTSFCQLTAEHKEG